MRPFVLVATVGAKSFKNGGVAKSGFLYRKIRAFVEREAMLVLEFGREEDGELEFGMWRWLLS